MHFEPVSPRQDLDTLAGWGVENLTRVIAIDSQSDEESGTIPSSEGQRRLSDHLRGFFLELGYEAEQDAHANLIVAVPSNLPPGRACPSVAFMVHMDTSEGTRAVPKLETLSAWDGSRIAYPGNDRLTVTVDNYPATRPFLGEDLLHGPGVYPVGLDDKLGMAEVMTLARILNANPEIPHGELALIFRPDEEIGSMEAVRGLASELQGRNVRYGYTVDGVTPFEVNVENFNASLGRVTIEGEPLRLPPAACGRRTTLEIRGVNTHGATAKAEGYLNATVIAARALEALGTGGEAVPVGFRSDPALECNARATFLVRGGSEAELEGREQALMKAFEAQVAPHAWKGAGVEVAGREPAPASGEGSTDAALRLLAHLRAFLSTPGVEPLLSEDSEGFQGYSNPHSVREKGRALVLDYRLRDFDPAELARREEHVRTVCRATDLSVEITAQYVNMGPELAKHPQLVEWAEEALGVLDIEPVKDPIRGGTGVDPFLERGIPVANLGTGYFAPESGKELTSRQNLVRHALWLAYLIQVIAARS
jgi:di/tripeptidase